DGELSSFEQQQLRKHLSRCPHCQATWKSMESLQEQVERLVEPDAPRELWERIMTALEKEAPKAASGKVIYYPAARGRMVAKGKEGESWFNTRFNRPSSSSKS
ncbi:MAG: zf-HC2 domain-containing protein, partial [Candidatus Poribacteria bacterium]